MAKPNDERGSLSLPLDQQVGSFYQTQTYPKFIVTSSLGLGWQFIETAQTSLSQVSVVAWEHANSVGVSPITFVSASQARYLLPLALTCDGSEENSTVKRYQVYLYRLCGRWRWISESDSQIHLYDVLYTESRKRHLPAFEDPFVVTTLDKSYDISRWSPLAQVGGKDSNTIEDAY